MALQYQYQHRRCGGSAITPTITAACGEDKPAATGGGGVPAAEYPCVRQSCQRRLLTFLWLQGFKAAFGSMIAIETDAFFSVPLLRQLVEQGAWANAGRYLARFVPPADFDGRLSVEAQVLHRFLHSLHSLASIVQGIESVAAASYNTCLDHGKTIGTGHLRMRNIVLNALHAKQYFRASMDWERVQRKASEIVDELAYRTPELKELVLMPGGPMKPHNVLPIGFGLRPRYRFKKQVRRPRASTLAKHFLLKKSLLPVSSNDLQGSHDELSEKALNWAADAIDDCLKAGKRQGLHQESPLQPSANKSAPSILDSQRRTLESQRRILESQRHTMINNATKSLESLVSSVRGTGPPVAPVYRTMNGKMEGPNANIFANPMLRTPAAPGAPFSATMFHPPVSRTIYGRLTNPDKSSGISLMTSAGTNKHPSLENVESSQQALNPEIHPRTELTTSNSQDLDPDRKPTTEALGDAGIGDKN